MHLHDRAGTLASYHDKGLIAHLYCGYVQILMAMDSIYSIYIHIVHHMAAFCTSCSINYVHTYIAIYYKYLLYPYYQYLHLLTVIILQYVNDHILLRRARESYHTVKY